METHIDTTSHFQARGLSTATVPSKAGIVELAEDVENAACQLWDMTAEKDVVLHLLEFGAFDILHLATDIITLSRAPRLTVSQRALVYFCMSHTLSLSL